MSKTEGAESFQSLRIVTLIMLTKHTSKGNDEFGGIYSAVSAFVLFDTWLIRSAPHLLSILTSFGSQTSKIYVFIEGFSSKMT